MRWRLLLAVTLGLRSLSAQDVGLTIDRLPQAVTQVKRDQLIIELPAMAVPANGMIGTPLYRVTIPFDASLYAFTVRVLDDSGHPVPRDRLHHIIMHDANRRGLFVPVALPVFGASKDSPDLALPKYLMGLPLPAGGRYLVAAMFMNPDHDPATFRVQVIFSVLRPGRVFPLFRVYPWAVDAKSPLGSEGGRHDFDLPIGRSCQSWEGSPQVGGRVVGIAGHAHDYATKIEIVDVTSGKTIWRQVPIRDAVGRVLAIPSTRFDRWYRLGIRIESSHRYRVRVCYDNPTGAIIPFGGMGSVMGLIAPDRGVPWPRLDPSDSIYEANVRNLLLNVGGMPMRGHDHE